MRGPPHSVSEPTAPGAWGHVPQAGGGGAHQRGVCSRGWKSHQSSHGCLRHIPVHLLPEERDSQLRKYPLPVGGAGPLAGAERREPRCSRRLLQTNTLQKGLCRQIPCQGPPQTCGGPRPAPLSPGLAAGGQSRWRGCRLVRAQPPPSTGATEAGAVQGQGEAGCAVGRTRPTSKTWCGKKGNGLLFC